MVEVKFSILLEPEKKLSSFFSALFLQSLCSRATLITLVWGTLLTSKLGFPAEFPEIRFQQACREIWPSAVGRLTKCYGRHFSFSHIDKVESQPERKRDE